MSTEKLESISKNDDDEVEKNLGKQDDAATSGFVTSPRTEITHRRIDTAADGDDDCGWDESETLTDRIRKSGENVQRIGSTSPHHGPSRSFSQNATHAADDEREIGNDERMESQGQERQPSPPSIWKELEQMQGRARGGVTMVRGGSVGGGGGGHQHPFRPPRHPIAPRFARPPTSLPPDNRTGGGDFNYGPRFGGRGGGRGGGGGRHFDRGSSRFRDSAPQGDEDFGSASTKGKDESYDDPTSAIAKGFGSLQVTVRGAGQQRAISASTSYRGNRGGGHYKAPFMDRRRGSDSGSNDESEESYTKQQHYRGRGRGRSGGDYRGGQRIPTSQYDDRAKGGSMYSVDDDRGEYQGRRQNRGGPIESGSHRLSDDHQEDASYRGGQQRTHRESPPLEPLRKAMDDADHFYRSTGQVISLFTKLADEYCRDDHDRWIKLIDQYAMVYAIDRGGSYVEFVRDIFVMFIDRTAFQKAAYVVLMRHVADLMAPRDWTEKDHEAAQNLCDLFGRLISSTWARGRDTCAKERNMVLFAIVDSVETWVQILDKATKVNSTIPDETVETSAVCLCHVTSTTGRKLWLKYPELVDRLYEILRSVIVSRSCPVEEETKLKLLDLYMKLNEWPKPANQQQNPGRLASKRDGSVQTDRMVAAPPAHAAAGWSPQPDVFVPSAFQQYQPPPPPPHLQQFSMPPPPIAYPPPAIPILAPPHFQQQQQPRQQSQGSRIQHGGVRLNFVGPMGKQ